MSTENETSIKKVLGRNEPCHCKSGKKYKHCCMDKDLDSEVMTRKMFSAHQFAAQTAILPDTSAIPLYPWLKPDFRGVGKYQPKE